MKKGPMPAEDGPRAVIRLKENAFIRSTPSAAGAVLGVGRKGDALYWGGATTPEGWLATQYRGVDAWVSGRFGDVKGVGKREQEIGGREQGTGNRNSGCRLFFGG